MINFLKNLLFPKFCVGCNKVGSYLCENCFSKLIKSKPKCFFCGRRNYLGLTCFSCSKPYKPEAVFSLFYYSSLLKKIIKAAKFRLAKSFFDEFLHQALASNRSRIDNFKKIIPKNTVITPVPLSDKRLKARGFNQSELILDNLNKYLNLKKKNILCRIKDNQPQSYLHGFKKRKQNIKGSFKAKQFDFSTLPCVLVVDDIITTGATMSTVVKLLKKSGVKKVFVFTLAQG